MSGELGFGFLLGLASRPVAFLALLSFYSCTNVVYARRIYRVLRHSVFDIILAHSPRLVVSAMFCSMQLHCNRVVITPSYHFALCPACLLRTSTLRASRLGGWEKTGHCPDPSPFRHFFGIRSAVA